MKGGIIGVYDLGGGTFDFSLLEVGDGVYEVKAVNGNNRLGGEDFDHILVHHFINKIKREYGYDLSSDPLALHRIKEALEQIKSAGYGEKYLGKQVLMVGVNFDSASKSVSEWVTETLMTGN